MSDTDRQPTCEERWAAALASTVDTLRGMYAAWIGTPRDEDCDENGECEYSEESLNEYGLSMQWVPGDEEGSSGHFEWCLSWGGPADYLRFYTTEDASGGTCRYVEYSFLDWFDGATHEVTGDDGQFLEELYDHYWADIAPSLR